MDVRQLELFLAVLECSSLTKAAEKAHLTPAAVSWRLQHLASDLNIELFVRSGRRFVPTPAALRLAELAEQVVRLMDQIEREFENESAADNRPFCFATGGTALAHQLGRPLRLLRRKFPNTPLVIKVCSTEEMTAGLLDRRFDLALLSLPLEEERLNIEPILEEEMLILKPSPTRVRVRHLGTMQLSTLATAPLLLYPKGTVMRRITDNFFKEAGISPNIVMEVDDAQAIKQLVEAGLGYAILSEYAIRGPQPYFQTFRIPGYRIVRQQALATVRSAHPRALTNSIAAFLRATLAPKK